MITKYRMKSLAVILFSIFSLSTYAQKVVVVPLGGSDYQVQPPLEFKNQGKTIIGLEETEISQPSLTINYIISIDGTFPTRTGSVQQDLPFLGQITMFAGTFPPRGWAFCDGQLVRAVDFPDLFRLLGNRFGGDPIRGTFAIPDLRSRVAVHSGNGPGLTRRIVGSKFGEETIGR